LYGVNSSAAISSNAISWGYDMADLAGISIVKEDEDGELYIEINSALMEQMGWSDHTMLEWEIIGNMAIVRKKEDDSA
jgi:hypothetical protein